jgi:hypothetical protein
MQIARRGCHSASLYDTEEVAFVALTMLICITPSACRHRRQSRYGEGVS